MTSGWHHLLCLPNRIMTRDNGSELARERPRRRWWQFSLRTLLIFIAILCGLFAWVGAKLRSVQLRRQAIANLKDFGFDIQNDMSDFVSDGVGDLHPPGPKWLRNWLGDDFFVDVVSVSSDVARDNDGSSRALGDDDLRWFCQFPHLKKLRFWGDLRITDERLAVLNNLPQLEELSLRFCPVTDAGMSYVGQLRQLKRLDLGHTGITDAGLQPLAGLTNLTQLQVQGTAVTTRGAQRLRSLLPSLEKIEMSIGD